MRGSQPWRTNRSRVLRAQPIAAEAKLWAKLRNRQLAGLKFVRQAPVGPYFVDFLCRERKVIVEVDGGTHSTDSEAVEDAARDAELRQLGFRILRVSNVAIYESVAGVLDGLLDFVEHES
jgi:very-short-patch-repair endonuclease